MQPLFANSPSIAYNSGMRQFVMVSIGYFVGSVIYDLLGHPADIEWGRAVFVGMFVGACNLMISKFRRAHK